MTKIPPGPWRIQDGCVLAADGDLVDGAQEQPMYWDAENPRHVLMCAAPELLETLRGVLDECIGPNEDPATWSEDSQVRKALELLARLDGTGG